MSKPETHTADHDWEETRIGYVVCSRCGSGSPKLQATLSGCPVPVPPRVGHTPSPWTSDISEDSAFVRASGYGLIADCGPPSYLYPDMAEANAHLIAAAPDLLVVLKALVVRTANMDDEGPHGETWQSPEMADEISAAHAAIAKAEGR